MRLVLLLLLATLALSLGLAAGVSAIAVHQTLLGLLLAAGAALASIRALRYWEPKAAAAFTGGWLLPVVVALVGRGEGDYAVSADGTGYLLIGLGLVILVTGLASGLRPQRRRDSVSGDVPA
jgi:hypothetical protein